MLAYLNVAIARLGTCRLHSHGQQTIVLRHEVETLENILLEHILLHHSLVTRRNDKVCLRIDVLDAVASPRDTRSSVAVNRLSHDVIAIDIRQLVDNIVQIPLGCVYENMVFGNYLCKSFVSLLQLSAAYSEKV